MAAALQEHCYSGRCGRQVVDVEFKPREVVGGRQSLICDPSPGHFWELVPDGFPTFVKGYIGAGTNMPYDAPTLAHASICTGRNWDITDRRAQGDDITTLEKQTTIVATWLRENAVRKL